MQIKKIIKKIIPRKFFDSLIKGLYPEKIHILEERLISLFLTQYQELDAPELNQHTVFNQFKISHTSKSTVKPLNRRIMKKPLKYTANGKKNEAQILAELTGLELPEAEKAVKASRKKLTKLKNN